MDDSFDEYPTLTKHREALRQFGEVELKGDMAEMRRVVEGWAASNPNTRNTPSPSMGKGESSVRNPVAYAIAAVAAVVIALFAAPKFLDNKSMPASNTTYLTRAAERAEVRLPDGTRVMLNVASRIEVPANFGRKNRTLTLNGEALFNVTHSSGAPFVVRTGNSETRVLGTSFAVRAYDEQVRVAVSTGRVAFDSQVLGAGSVASKINGKVATQNRDVQSLLAWSTGNLVIADVPFSVAIPDLERWYDVQIRVEDASLLSRTFRATLKAGTPADLAEIIALTFNVQAELHGRILTINRKTS